MKPKNFSKKLFLNKKTIADLSNKKMKDVFGGVQTKIDCTYGRNSCEVTGPCASNDPGSPCADPSRCTC
jgi:hypothetical protein